MAGKKPSVMAALKAVGKGDPRQTTIPGAARGEKPEAPRARPTPQTKTGAQTSGSSNPSRIGKVNVTGYFDPAVKQSLRLIQAKNPERRTEQDLLAEALDDLFAKYGVPQCARSVHL